MGGWGIIILGLIFLLIYAPIGIIILIIGAIVLAMGKGKKVKQEKWKEGVQVRESGWQSEMKKCPKCAEEVKSEALICRFCGHKFPEPTVLPERILCSDGNCLGVINEKGVCNICGKPDRK